jgi:enoyl-CoA hydratase
MLKKPLIAAVEGQALAGGFEIALACDLIVAAEDARFGFTQMQIGLVPDAGGLVRLQRQLPAKIAAELVLTGETVSSALLASLGLLNRVVPRGEALTVARQLAAHIVANDALAVEVAKRVVRESEDWSTTEMFDRQNEITAPLFEAARARRFSVS